MHKSQPTQPPLLVPSPEAPPRSEKILTVRYSLPVLLSEIREERASSSLAMEKVHQAEINKLFSTKPKVRRGKAKH